VKVSGDKRLQAPRPVVWEVLNDPARMAKLMPGVESFEVQDERNWTAKVKVPLGLGALPLSFSFEKTDEREPEYARLTARGNGVGAIVRMDTQFRLSEDGGATTMAWEADVSIAGPVGAMGQRVLQPIVNQQVGNVLSALEAQVLEAAGGDREGAPPEGAPAAPAGAEEGIHPAAPETYSAEPEGPTHSTKPEGPAHSTNDEG
jgi:carbon monoxide dehydrogenase subunit G